MAYIGLRVDHAVEAVSARAATVEEARRLGLAPAAVVQSLERTYYCGQRPVETANLVVPAEPYRLVYEFPVAP